jgi:hypothetical protein
MTAAFAFWIWVLFQGQSGEININPSICEDASTSFIIASLAFDAVAVVLAIILKWLLDRMLWKSSGARLALTLLLAVVLSSALVAWNPLRDEVLDACIQSAQFSRYVLMAHVAAIPRGLILGGLVSAVVFLLLSFVIGKLAKWKRS